MADSKKKSYLRVANYDVKSTRNGNCLNVYIFNMHENV